MCVDEASEEVRQIVYILLGGDGFELELLGGEHPSFYLIGSVDVALGHYVLNICLELTNEAFLMSRDWRIDVLWRRWRGFLFLFFDGLADEDFVYLLALVGNVLFKESYLLLEDFLL